MEDKSREFIGMRVRQVTITSLEFQKHIGRVGTVEEAFTDEKGVIHVKTQEDGVWCPLNLTIPCVPPSFQDFLVSIGFPDALLDKSWRDLSGSQKLEITLAWSHL